MASSSFRLSYYSSFYSIADANNIYVLGSDEKLWLEHSVNGKFGKVPPPRQQVDGNVRAFQPIDLNNIYVLGTDGNLWLEHAINGKFGQVPPPREKVDAGVRAFQSVDLNNIYVLDTQGNLWLEHSVNGKFGQVPPPREQVDGNVLAFQLIDANNIYVLGTDGNLWLEHAINGKFGQVPPPREQVDGNVLAFQLIDTNNIYVLGTDGNLWLEHSVNGKFGQVPPPRQQVDGNVAALQALDLNTIYVLGSDGNLWLEHSVNGKFGQVPPPREQVDGNVENFQAVDSNTIYVLGTDANLWLEHSINGKFGQVPPPREHVDGNVGLAVPIDPAPAPGSGLGSNSNYILYNDCHPLTGLAVTINVTQDLVCGTASGQTKGLAFQLNAYSPQKELSAWQQYCLILWDTELTGMIDNWPVSGNNIINNIFSLKSLPNTTIPAGYRLSILLENDSSANINGVRFIIVDNQGNTLADVSRALLSIAGVTSGDLAPIVAFELNLVGPINSESTVLTSGAGTITYSASSPLTVLNQEPACTESGYFTAETANSLYGVMPASQSNRLTQSFNVGPEATMIRAVGKRRPETIFPAGTKPAHV